MVDYSKIRVSLEETASFVAVTTIRRNRNLMLSGLIAIGLSKASPLRCCQVLAKRDLTG